MLKVILCSLVAIFIIIVSVITVPTPAFIKQKLFPFVAVLSIAYFFLGIALVFLTRKRKVKGKLRKFLILAGISSSGFFVSVLLHNFLYGLGLATSHIIILSRLMEILHGLFFFVAIFICPLGFLIGIAGSMVLFIKKRNMEKT